MKVALELFGRMYDMTWPLGACTAFFTMALIELIVALLTCRPRGEKYGRAFKKTLYEKTMYLVLIMATGVAEFSVGLLLTNISPWFTEEQTVPFVFMPLFALWSVICSMASILIYADIGGVKIPNELLILAGKILHVIEQHFKK